MPPRIFAPDRPMNAARIRELADAALSGTLSFPEIVGKLIDEGVEYYVVNYATLQFSFHDGEGSVVLAPLAFEGLPSIAKDFSASALRAAILDSQQNGQKFRQFSRRAMEAGVQSYYAFLRGQRVTYLGRQGDQHVEWFPGAKPPDA